jgi:hypothetical protein
MLHFVIIKLRIYILKNQHDWSINWAMYSVKNFVNENDLEKFPTTNVAHSYHADSDRVTVLIFEETFVKLAYIESF